MNLFKKKYVQCSIFLILFISFCPGLFAQNASGLQGKWVLIPDESTALSYYNTINLDIQQENTTLRIVQKWNQNSLKLIQSNCPPMAK